ncbi:DUF3179 domain-containing protein [Changchengzhania lutea]|uniref:DUF3179 domain-containing protein n=1 Tax=Changchengzhania lutea TaxID=2049305 RepID=UPI00115E6BB5|nr:DUF3179 domain-containing protein [Changchengzhania lutea]
MKKNVFYVLILLFFTSCSSSGENDSFQSNPNNNDGNPSSDNTPNWLIPVSEVRDGGPGKDGIPSIDNPQFITASEANFINASDLVVGIVDGNEARAYPHQILDWHEIVNDDINGNAVTINYCPLTGTAFGWKSESNGVKTTFGVSGLLYNANLILYDRSTDSNWSQLRLECVNGELISQKPKLLNVVETTWDIWKTLYPNTKVLSLQTGFSRQYSVYPYGDYAVNNARFIFRPSILNNDLPNKERVYGIIDDNKSRAYQFSKFGTGKVIKDTFNNKNYVVAGNQSLIYAFELTGDYINLNFEYDFNSSEGVFFKDDEGNKWDVFGKAIAGPRKGETLTGAKSVVSYWFALAVFYPNPLIYQD